MLRAEDGATIKEIATALSWRPHTVRGAIAGALKKKLGLEVISEQVADRGGFIGWKLTYNAAFGVGTDAEVERFTIVQFPFGPDAP
jgi:hypothetical protein